MALVVCLLRKNVTQEFAGAIFGVSQATVSRRWDLLRPLIGQVLGEFVPHPREVVGAGTVLVDGTVCPTWDWRHIKRLPNSDLTTSQADFNTALSKIRAAVEHAIAHLKTWRMISEEGGRYRAPIQNTKAC